MDDTQHSSLPGHSVSAPLHIVRCIYEEAAEERMYNPKPRHLHVLYCDYAKAFDSIPGFIVDAALRTMGVPEHFIHIFNFMDTHAWNKISTDHGLSPGFHMVYLQVWFISMVYLQVSGKVTVHHHSGS